MMDHARRRRRRNDGGRDYHHSSSSSSSLQEGRWIQFPQPQQPLDDDSISVITMTSMDNNQGIKNDNNNVIHCPMAAWQIREEVKHEAPPCMPMRRGSLLLGGSSSLAGDESTTRSAAEAATTTTSTSSSREQQLISHASLTPKHKASVPPAFRANKNDHKERPDNSRIAREPDYCHSSCAAPISPNHIKSSANKTILTKNSRSTLSTAATTKSGSTIENYSLSASLSRLDVSPTILKRKKPKNKSSSPRVPRKIQSLDRPQALLRPSPISPRSTMTQTLSVPSLPDKKSKEDQKKKKKPKSPSTKRKSAKKVESAKDSGSRLVTCAPKGQTKDLPPPPPPPVDTLDNMMLSAHYHLPSTLPAKHKKALGRSAAHRQQSRTERRQVISRALSSILEDAPPLLERHPPK